MGVRAHLDLEIRSTEPDATPATVEDLVHDLVKGLQKQKFEVSGRVNGGDAAGGFAFEANDARQYSAKEQKAAAAPEVQKIAGDVAAAEAIAAHEAKEAGTFKENAHAVTASEPIKPTLAEQKESKRIDERRARDNSDDPKAKSERQRAAELEAKKGDS